MSATTSSPSSPARLGLWHWVAFVVGVTPLVVYAFSPRVGDLDLYFKTARAFLAGATPNQDFRFEYPPYALLWFVPAAWLRATQWEFVPVFGLQLAFLDGFIKWVLLVEGARRWGRTWRSFVPCVAYSLTSWAAALYYLKRYDLIPATLTMVALLALCRRRDTLAGLALAVGVVTKLYPVVLVPLALVVCWRRGTLTRLWVGLTLGVAPLLPLSLVWPWWGFASFHVDRGLQVESLGASLLWAAQQLGLVHGVTWVHAPAAYELHGVLAQGVRVVCRWLWVLGSLGMAAVGMWSVHRRQPEQVEDLARLVLGPLVVFIILNPVLSPQFLTWVMGAAALALLSGSRTVPVLILAAAILSRGVFVGASYRTGLGGPQTLLLLLRNGMLFVAGCLLLRDTLRRASARKVPAGHPPPVAYLPLPMEAAGAPDAGGATQRR
ncbi:glycosyltransferase 87 family protein [Myxococcus stipitatus]|uniref:glycosyltransferase 87 family protein n=1 Tax=Myxococcus stipitatus TaxID=83455 RepID=UPI001F158D7B|nr:glycosyltransferase 87 family protein [Myxococcus stipitatus]MCE9666556.1 glycosyltransferase 87 family protein [Myxococcus stipitatus]